MQAEWNTAQGSYTFNLTFKEIGLIKAALVISSHIAKDDEFRDLYNDFRFLDKAPVAGSYMKQVVISDACVHCLSKAYCTGNCRESNYNASNSED
jgi:radical SAM protein with 4Fe4S-binding SPASM domain